MNTGFHAAILGYPHPLLSANRWSWCAKRVCDVYFGVEGGMGDDEIAGCCLLVHVLFMNIEVIKKYISLL